MVAGFRERRRAHGANDDWPYHTRVDDLLVVSVGTGTSTRENLALTAEEMNILYNAANIPSALMSAALNEQDFLCRVFGQCVAGAPLDREIGDMIGSAGPFSNKVLPAVRAGVRRRAE
jgi:uncharacterized protein